MEHVAGKNLTDGNTEHSRGRTGRKDGKGRVLRQKEKRAAEEERGVSRLTGSPSVLGLPPPSVYRCPAETEGTTELHTPPSSTLLTATLETSWLYGRILVPRLF